jgi:trimeric autotransporter adhesin
VNGRNDRLSQEARRAKKEEKIMNRLNIDPRSKTPALRTLLCQSLFRWGLFSACTVACLALSTARAVDPPPDGGYPGGNTAEGAEALFSLTTGLNNTAIGDSALFFNTTAFNNTATGYLALFRNTTGSENTANGSAALSSNTTGLDNTATGSGALFNNTTGNDNTATGTSALTYNTTGFNNTATGDEALLNNTTGSFNTASGLNALASNTTGTANTASGSLALIENTIGNNNTASGDGALFNNTSGDDNTASGVDALLSNTTGNNNTADGNLALQNNTTGSSNIALGDSAGSALTTGNNNIDIGNAGLAGESSVVRIGTAGTQTATFIAGISGATVARGVAVVIDADGHLGVKHSSARFKEAIKPMDKASEAILSLQPVTFRYKHDLDPDGIPQFGLVAEQVEKINPDLVARDREGKPYTVRYEAVNAMLLNEFLKEHRRVEQQSAAITQMKSSAAKQGAVVVRLESMLKQQQDEIAALTSQLRSVKTALDADKAASRLVAHNP